MTRPAPDEEGRALGARTVVQLLKEVSARLGEPIEVAEFTRYELPARFRRPE